VPLPFEFINADELIKEGDEEEEDEGHKKKKKGAKLSEVVLQSLDHVRRNQVAPMRHTGAPGHSDEPIDGSRDIQASGTETSV
jgi:hypothetical protein